MNDTAHIFNPKDDLLETRIEVCRDIYETRELIENQRQHKMASIRESQQSSDSSEQSQKR
jgi:hypothetical protein